MRDILEHIGTQKGWEAQNVVGCGTGEMGGTECGGMWHGRDGRYRMWWDVAREGWEVQNTERQWKLCLPDTLRMEIF